MKFLVFDFGLVHFILSALQLGMVIPLSPAGGLVPTGSPRAPWVLIEEKLSKQQGDEK